MRRITISREKFNAVYVPYLFDEHRYQVFFGGAASGKSAFLAARAVIGALGGRNTLIVRKVGARIRASCWNETLKAIDRLGLAGRFRVNKSDGVIEAPCGAQILFTGVDNAEKIKSVSPRRGALTDIWIEEATELNYEDYKQLDKRLRGISKYKKRMTLSFNPAGKDHWLYREFFGSFDETKRTYQDEKLLILRTTCEDNRFLDDSDRRDLRDERDGLYRKTYFEGLWASPEGTVFQNWSVEQIPADITGETRMGLDFGFSGDPCGFVRLRYDRGTRTVFVLEEFCEKGLTNLMLADKLKEIARGGYVTCDSAEPKSIAELRALGIRALAARKGPDSVVHGIQWLQGQKIIIAPGCKNLIREMSCYSWQKDASGSPIARPEDRNNHLIDAMRYALESDENRRYAKTEGG